MKNKTKISIKYNLLKAGFIYVFAMAILMTITFIIAFIHPSNTVLININVLGEMYLEFILVSFAIPLIIASMIITKKNVLPKMKEGGL